MLRFTTAGLVSAPTTVQIRVTQSMRGRLSAGAPQPERTLTNAEIVQNIRFFTEGMTGPRTRPCAAMVLSGEGLLQRPGLAEIIGQGREQGLTRVVLHGVVESSLPGGVTELLDQVDELSVVVRTKGEVSQLEALVSMGFVVAAVVPLEAGCLPHLEGMAQVLIRARPDRVIFTWPLHGPPPPPAGEAVAALSPAVDALTAAGVAVGVKGLPACALGRLADLGWRTSNRWYVDAGHQCAEALLFFPDVVRFARQDECRWCRVQNRCDGAVAGWLAAGLVGPLQALPDQP